MKKIAVFVIVLLCAAFATVAFAADKGETMIGSLLLFQKCDASLIPDEDSADAQYDANGCPLSGNGPWGIFLENRRWGQMRYNLIGDTFRFSFQGKRLIPDTDYALIYYPDGWPGTGLICLGSSTSNPNGNVQIRGSVEILTGLPAPYDKNYNPVEPSGASGAKIWLVPAADVKCESTGDIDPETGLAADPAQLLAWNPASYLFEGNMIVYQYATQAVVDDDDDDDSDVDEDADLSKKRPGKSKSSDADTSGDSGKGKKK